MSSASCKFAVADSFVFCGCFYSVPAYRIPEMRILYKKEREQEDVQNAL